MQIWRRPGPPPSKQRLRPRLRPRRAKKFVWRSGLIIIDSSEANNPNNDNFWYELAQPLKDPDNNPNQNCYLPFQRVQDPLIQFKGFLSLMSSATTSRMITEDRRWSWSKPTPPIPYLREEVQQAEVQDQRLDEQKKS